MPTTAVNVNDMHKAGHQMDFRGFKSPSDESSSCTDGEGLLDPVVPYTVRSSSRRIKRGVDSEVSRKGLSESAEASLCFPGDCD